MVGHPRGGGVDLCRSGTLGLALFCADIAGNNCALGVGFCPFLLMCFGLLNYYGLDCALWVA